MDPIHHLKRPQLYENECRWYVGTLVCYFFRNIPMYQCTICIYMYKHTDSMLVRYEKRLLTWYVGMLQKMHPKYIYIYIYIYILYIYVCIGSLGM